MADRRDRSGFVLLVVLAVLVIASVAMAAAARRASRSALAAGEAVEQLQVQWGRRSIERLWEADPGRLLADAEADKKGRPPAKVSCAITLGGVEFTAIISDEQAKANVNLLAARAGGGDISAALTKLQSDCRAALPVRPRPTPPPEGLVAAVPLRFATHAQVFQFDRPAELIDVRAEQLRPGDLVTCWGSGRVNFKTAPAEVLRAVCAGVLGEGEIARLLQIAADDPDCGLEAAIAALELPEEAQTEAKRLLTDGSGAYGLWVAAEGRTRNWYSFTASVAAAADEDRQYWTFQW